MKRIYMTVLAAVIASIAISCIHEYPDTATPADVTVEFSFELSAEMPELKDTYNAHETAPSDEEYDFRYQIRAYRLLPTGGFAKEPLHSYCFTKDEVDDLKYTNTLKLREGNYKLLAWVDYVKDGSADDLYFGTENFSRIELLGEEHVANTVVKDVFIGESVIEAIRYGSEVTPVRTVIELTRPVGKYEIITTDLKEFKKEQQAKVNDIPVDLDECYAMISYRSYMPNSFNLGTSKPNDAASGISFKSSIVEMNENEACLGFDYVLIPEETTISISVAFYSNDGTLMTDTGAFDIDLKRGHVTRIFKTYLTGSVGGGLGIDTEFEGDNNIYLN